MRLTTPFPRRGRWRGAALAALLLLGACTGEPGAQTAVTGTTTPGRGKVGPPAPSEDASQAPVGEAGTRSSELILRALAAGEITEHEAVVRRVQARFGDPGLPSRFTGVAGVDPTALVEAWNVLEDLPADWADLVRPYLLRPTEAGSAFAPAPSGDGGASAAGGPMTALVQQAAAGPQECPSWVSRSLEPAPFRVWACATKERTQGSEILGPDLEEQLSMSLQSMVLPRPYGMGRPLEDQPDHRQHWDSDGLIDIYLLPKGSLAPTRDGYQAPMQDAHGSDVWGQAIPTPAASSAGRGTSGYVLVDERLLAVPETLLITVLHEAFHVKQFRFNVPVLPEVSWFMEASAIWAELHYGPSTHREPYDTFLEGLQTSPLALTATEPHEHQYQAHLWPLYMQQHAEEGADSIFAVWESLVQTTPAGAAEHLVRSIDQKVPWRDHYPQFALQLLNRTLPGDPVSPLFDDADIRFPGGRSADLAALNREHRLPADTDPVLNYLTWEAGDGGGGPIPSGVPALGYRYDRIVIDRAGLPATWGVELRPDDSLRSTGGAAAMEVLLKEEDGTFRRAAVDPASGGSWCNVEEIIVVLTVPDTGASVQGMMTATVDEAPVCDLSGDLQLDVSADYRSPARQIPNPTIAEMQITGALDVVLGPVQERPEDPNRYIPPPGAKLPPGVDREEILAGIEMVRSYPDAGSTWSVTGTLVEQVCIRESWDCAPVHTVDFTTGDPSRLSLEVIEKDGEFTLTGRVPVLVTYTSHHPPEAAQHREVTWELACHSSGQWFSWGGARSPGMIYLGGSHPDRDHPISGPRERGSHVVDIDCEHTWSPSAYSGEDGEVSTIRQSWTGQFRVGQ